MKRFSTLLAIVVIALVAIFLSSTASAATNYMSNTGVTKRGTNVLGFNTNLAAAGSTVTSNVNSSSAVTRGAGLKVIKGIQIQGQTASKNYWLMRNTTSPDDHILWHFLAPATLNGNPVQPVCIDIPVEGLIYKTDETLSGTGTLLLQCSPSSSY